MVGIAYQIYDDCLDYTFTNSRALKDTQKDIIQGSYTAPLLCAMELDNSGKLKNLLEKPMTEEIIDEIQQTVRNYRGPEIAMEYALDYFSKITDDARELSSRRNIDLDELIDGLHRIIEMTKNAIL
jgi:heptaprenyl diphosphate synthase